MRPEVLMLSYVVDTMGYLIESNILDDALSCGAVAACICVVRIMFSIRSDRL